MNLNKLPPVLSLEPASSNVVVITPQKDKKDRERQQQLLN